MTGSIRQDRTPCAMTVRELARLRTLYERLVHAERWIGAVAGEACARACRKAGSRDATEHSATSAHTFRGLREGARVYCCSHASDEETVVAVLNCATLLCGDLLESGAIEDGSSAALPPPLSDLRGSRLFHELHEDYLNGSWDRLLEIDGIRIELSPECCGERVWS
jgi:hypothetical protein